MSRHTASLILLTFLTVSGCAKSAPPAGLLPAAPSDAKAGVSIASNVDQLIIARPQSGTTGNSAADDLRREAWKLFRDGQLDAAMQKYDDAINLAPNSSQ